MPQTSASIDSRIKILSDTLVKEFPLIAWKICLSQVYIGQILVALLVAQDGEMMPLVMEMELIIKKDMTLFVHVSMY